MHGLKRKADASSDGQSDPGLQLLVEAVLQRDFANCKDVEEGHKSCLVEHHGLTRELVARNCADQLSLDAMTLAESQIHGPDLTTLSRMYIQEHGTGGLDESCFVFMKIMSNWLCSASKFHDNTRAAFNGSNKKKTVVLEGKDNVGTSLVIRSLAPLVKLYGEVVEKIKPAAMHQHPMAHRILCVDEPDAKYLRELEDTWMGDFPLFITTNCRATWKKGPLQDDCYFVHAGNSPSLHNFDGSLHPGVWYILDLVCKGYTGKHYFWRPFAQLMTGASSNVTKAYQDGTWDDTVSIITTTEHNDLFLAYCMKHNCRLTKSYMG